KGRLTADPYVAASSCGPSRARILVPSMHMWRQTHRLISAAGKNSREFSPMRRQEFEMVILSAPSRVEPEHENPTKTLQKKERAHSMLKSVPPPISEHLIRAGGADRRECERNQQVRFVGAAIAPLRIAERFRIYHLHIEAPCPLQQILID